MKNVYETYIKVPTDEERTSMAYQYGDYRRDPIPTLTNEWFMDGPCNDILGALIDKCAGKTCKVVIYLSK